MQFWALLIAILYVSLQSLSSIDPLPINDKLLHLIVYTGLAISAKLAYPRSPHTAILWVCLVVFSIALEFGQQMVPGRSYETKDMLANGAGLMLGFILWEAGLLFFKSLKPKQTSESV